MTPTYQITATEGGFNILGANHESAVMAKRPNGPGILNTVPRKLFRTEKLARDYLTKHDMQEATP